MSQEKKRTLETGFTRLQVIVDDQTQIVVAGTFGGTVSLTDPTGVVQERLIVGNESFASAMTHMLFTLTGTGPIEVTIYPLRVGKIAKMNLIP